MQMCLQAVGMIRRLKQDVLADLPPKRRMRVPILTDPACTRVRRPSTYLYMGRNLNTSSIPQVSARHCVNTECQQPLPSAGASNH